MTAPKTASWTKMLVQIGDGASTEVFSQPCALITKGLSFTAETSDSNVPDCDTPDAPSFVQRIVKSLSGEVSGGGRLALSTHALWRAWFLSGASKNVRIKLDLPLADDGGYYACRFVLTKFGLSGNESDGKLGVDVTMQSDGAPTWVPAVS